MSILMRGFGWLLPRSARERQRQRFVSGLRAGMSGVESVLGLPHALVLPLLRRHFRDDARPSDAAFASSGRNGYWTLPPPHPDVEVRVHAHEAPRVVLGRVSGRGAWAGIHLETQWSATDPAPVWTCRIDPAAGASLAVLEDVLRQLDCSAASA